MRLDEIDKKPALIYGDPAQPKRPNLIGTDHGNEQSLRLRAIKSLTKFINTNCSEFLGSVKESHQFLYRGILGPGNLGIFLGQSRSDRQVIAKTRGHEGANEGQKVANMCDELLVAAGFTAVRGNSIFCNPVFNNAGLWGSVYIIFPINGFSFGYSLQFTNSTAEAYQYPPYSQKYPYQPSNDQVDYLLAHGFSEEEAQEFAYKNSIFHTNLAQAMEKNRDIWIHGKYLGVPNSYSYELCKYYGVPQPNGLHPGLQKQVRVTHGKTIFPRY